MTQKQLLLLEEAREHFYAWRMLDAYNIFRRFFDRLPFSAEKEHAEFIGPFVRVLFELGKEFELKFYLAELEKLYQKQKHPHIAYALGFLYSYSGAEKVEAARQVFESIVRDPSASDFHAKSKMMLADYHLRKGDVHAAHLCIDSVGEVEDPTNATLLQIWKAVIARREQKFEQARDLLIAVILTLDCRRNWYSYFSAMNVLAMVHVDLGDLDRAQLAVGELEKLFDQGKFRSVREQIESLQCIIQDKKGNGLVRLVKRDTDRYEFFHRDRCLPLNPKISQDRLLLTLLKKGFIEKAIIIRGIYGREYVAEKDDKLIYYHIHNLRKRLRAVGLPNDVLLSEKEGYRWATPVETTVEEL